MQEYGFLCNPKMSYLVLLGAILRKKNLIFSKNKSGQILFKTASFSKYMKKKNDRAKGSRRNLLQDLVGD